MPYRSTLRRISLAALAFLLALLPASLALACPTCKSGLTDQYVNAYGWSIIFMMSMPFLILGSLSAYFYWEVLRARAAQAAATERATQAGETASESAEARDLLEV